MKPSLTTSSAEVYVPSLLCSPPHPILFLHSVTKLGSFARRLASQSTEMLAFAAKKVFIHKAAKYGDGRTSVRPTSPKVGAQGVYGIIELGGPRCGEHGKRCLE